jgi:hypothetical protein
MAKLRGHGARVVTTSTALEICRSVYPVEARMDLLAYLDNGIENDGLFATHNRVTTITSC